MTKTNRLFIFILEAFVSIQIQAQNVTMVDYEQNWNDDEAVLTLKNNTDKPVTYLNIRILYYNMYGVQIDYRDYNLVTDIAPHLAKRISVGTFERSHNFYYFKSKGTADGTPFKVKIVELKVLKKDTTIDDALNTADIMPSFKGNVNAWLAQHLQYPAVAAENGVQGKVLIRFIVGKDGTISHAYVVRSVDLSLDREALRAVQSMPKWNPGWNDGKPATVWFTLPVTFKLQ